MRLTLALIPAALLAPSACDKSEQPSADGNSVGADMPADATASGATAADAMPSGAQAFVDAAAASDSFEIESSKLAQTMGKASGVKAFAAMMVKDHTKSTADLKAAAAKANPAAPVAPKLTAEQQADLGALKGAGDNFDKLYAEKQVAGHEKALAMLKAYADNGSDPALKGFAAKAVPVVSGHLDQAKQLPK